MKHLHKLHGGLFSFVFFSGLGRFYVSYPDLNKKQWKNSELQYSLVVPHLTGQQSHLNLLSNALGLWGIKPWLLWRIPQFSNRKYYRSIAVTPFNEEWNPEYAFDLVWFFFLMCLQHFFLLSKILFWHQNLINI